MMRMGHLPIAFGALLLAGAMMQAVAQDAPGLQDGPLGTQQAAPIERSAPETPAPEAQTLAAEALPPGRPRKLPRRLPRNPPRRPESNR